MPKTNPNSNAAQEVSDQAEYNYYLMEAPIADFAKFAGIELDEAVARRIEAVRQIPNLSEIEVDVRLLNNPQGKLIGLASVKYHGFNMDNFKVFNGENGLFLGEPTVKVANRFEKSIRVTGEELRDALNQKAFDGYNAAVEKLAARAAEARNTEIKPSMQKQYAESARQAAEYNAARPTPERSGKTQAAEH
ncbi:MAG: SpoVG family protein [Oscillospiraceae bacterium]|jgi:DNA-binding cell septation regulator SpoVG|nr:SpoVG family protein [Oscillospiraceae bacterium]